MKKQKCDDCITRPMTIKKMFAILSTVVTVAFSAGIAYAGYNELKKNDKKQTELLTKMAHNLNTLNINLFKKGDLDNLDIVYLKQDSVVYFAEVIYPVEKPKRVCTKLSTSEKNFKD